MLQGFLIPLVALYMQACYTRARACVRVCTRERTALKDAGWRARFAPFRYAAALIGAHGRGDGHGLAVHRPDRPALRGGEYSPKKWQKGRFPAPAGVGAIL